MNKNLRMLTKLYEGEEVVFRNNPTGISEVCIDNVAKFCGWEKTEIKNGKEYKSLRMSTINGFLKELGFDNKLAKGDFIPERIMYPLIGKAKNERATKFMIWVGEVLEQLRKTGVVILDHAEPEAIDFEKKYGKYRIRKTFMKSENIMSDYREFKELSQVEWKAKRLNNNDRIKLSNIICDALEERLKNNMIDMKGSEMLSLREAITDIKDDIIKLGNKKHGGIKAGQTKEINALEKQNDKLVDRYINLLHKKAR